MHFVTDVQPDVLKMKYYDIQKPQFVLSRYEADGSLALGVMDEGRPMVLSVNLLDYGQIAPLNHVFVKDYAENEGLPASLEAAGVAERVSPVSIGFGAGWLMKLSFDAESEVPGIPEE